MPAGAQLRDLATWSVTHGLQRAALRAAARQGDLTARLTIDPALAHDPFNAYEQLRGRGSLVRSRLVTATVDHAAANQILRGEDFGTAAGHAELPPPVRWIFERVSDPRAISPVDPPSLLAIDPPQHTAHRKLVARAFTARRIARLSESVAALTARFLDEIAVDLEAGREVDLINRFAARLPVAVIAEILGVPAGMRDSLLEWGNRAAITLDPGLTRAEFHDAAAALREMHGWFDQHVAQLRRDPGEDLLSQLTQLGPDQALSEIQLRTIGLLVLGAGFETTVNLIGNAVAALEAHPDQRKLALADPDLWPGVVEETLRWDSPVQLTMRSALRDTEVAGEPIAAGTPMLMFLGGANRDPAVFEEPAAFDITRGNADQHLAFSAGVHFCLGASLARLEAATALRSLYERFPGLAIARAPERRGTRVLRGYERLAVTAER